MDEGPFRVPRSVNENDDKPPVEEKKPVIQPKPIQERSKTVHRSSHPSLTEKKSKKKVFIIAGAIVALLIALVAGWTLWSGTQGGAAGVDSGKYQAVFFTNGQVYFGKLQSFNSEYMKLKDVYYLQTQKTDEESGNPQQTQSSTNSDGLTLIKLGSEIHGPEDEMIVAKDQVLFYENLKKDGKVSQSIEQSKKSQ